MPPPLFDSSIRRRAEKRNSANDTPGRHFRRIVLLNRETRSSRTFFRETRPMRTKQLAVALALPALALALATAAPTSSVQADDYPTRPIRLIVPFAAGGAADSVARIVGKRIGEALGQAVVVEDRGGGGGIIAT